MSASSAENTSPGFQYGFDYAGKCMQRPDDAPPQSAPIPRRAARVLLRNTAGRVLLLRYDVSGYVFWAAPGGAVEPGETDKAAATRELFEELHLSAALTGPIHSTIGRFHHEGRYVENTDIFFTAVITAKNTTQPAIFATTGFEAACLREARWWTLNELDATNEKIFPRDIVSVLSRLQAADQ